MYRAKLTIVLGFWLMAAVFAVARADAGLAGQLLVANRHLRDPHFVRSVIYVIDHSDAGAMGLIVNRSGGRASLREVLRQLGIRSRSRKSVTLFYGGPVELGRGFLLHSPDYRGASTQLLGKTIALSTDAQALQAIAAGKGPRRSRLVLGYAGWGGGQLDQEVARADWLIAPADPDLVFARDPEAVWEQALRFAGMRL